MLAVSSLFSKSLGSDSLCSLTSSQVFLEGSDPLLLKFKPIGEAIMSLFKFRDNSLSAARYSLDSLSSFVSASTWLSCLSAVADHSTIES